MANSLFKTCKRCDVRKEIRYFSKNERMPGGHISVCKACKVKTARLSRATKIKDSINNSELLKNWGKV